MVPDWRRDKLVFAMVVLGDVKKLIIDCWSLITGHWSVALNLPGLLDLAGLGFSPTGKSILVPKLPFGNPSRSWELTPERGPVGVHSQTGVWERELGHRLPTTDYRSAVLNLPGLLDLAGLGFYHWFLN